MGSLSPIAVASGAEGGVEWAWASRPCAGERVSGDTVRVAVIDDRLHIAVVDVLGHGPEAYAVARRIDEFLVERDLSDASAVIGALHRFLENTLGAAIGVGTLHPATGELSWAAVGNTVARRLGARPARLVSQDGIVGQILPEVRPGSLVLGEGDVIVVHTDGLPSSLDQEAYPQFRAQGAATIAHTLIHRFARITDDATAVVLRRAR